MRVYLLGTEQDPDAVHLGQLMSNQAIHAIDCRFNPWSSRTAWQKSTLVKEYGVRYHAAGSYLGNAKHPSNALRSGPCEIKLVNPEAGIAGLVGYLQEGYDLVLIGHYLDYQYSHLTEVIRLLTEKMPDVEILLPEEKPVPMPSRGHIKVGAKVLLGQGKEQVPAVILKTAFSPNGDYLLCWLRIAKQNPLNSGAWLISEVGPVQSYKLKVRHSICHDLDDEVLNG